MKFFISVHQNDLRLLHDTNIKTSQLLGAVFPFPIHFIRRALLGNTILGQKSDFISVHQNDLRLFKDESDTSIQLLDAVFPFPAPFIRRTLLGNTILGQKSDFISVHLTRLFSRQCHSKFFLFGVNVHSAVQNH
jgi:hypothetical protein